MVSDDCVARSETIGPREMNGGHRDVTAHPTGEEKFRIKHA
jgi:hypothetical protein